MSDSEQERRVEPIQAGLPEPKPNPGIGVLRFFVWLMPTAIVVGSLALNTWFASKLPASPIWSNLTILIAVAGSLLCAWFDSKLALPCRLGKRHYGSHMTIFMLTQILFVVPALLFAIVYAICVSAPW